MTLLRPEATALLRRWREILAAVGLGLIGLWFLSLGGYFFAPLALLTLGLATGWGLIARRRLRFLQPVAAPGMVEIDEGQIGYLGPTFGGYVAVRELVEVRMIVLHGRRHWRLKQADGQALLIPASATGAEQLFDAFAALPGVDMAAVTAAFTSSADTLLVWRRPARAALT